MIAAICAERLVAVEARNVRRLQTFLSFFDVEFDFFALVQRAVTTVRILNRGKVNEKVLITCIGGDKAIPFAVIEPLDCALLFSHFAEHPFYSVTGAKKKVTKKAPKLP